MISCYIIDDEQHAIEILEKYIGQTPGLQMAGSSTNPLQALEVFRDQKYPDITFIDVDMPQLSGIELGELLQHKTSVVFVTAYDKFAIRAFEQNALDYVLKPILYERFLKCINKLNSRTVKPSVDGDNSQRGHFFIQYEMKGKILKIEYQEVIYIEAMKNYIIIHTVNSQYITYLTMKEIEENLPASMFMRVHKSFILNLDKVVSIDGNVVQLKNNKQIVTGASYKDLFLNNLKEKMIRTRRSAGS